jgi:hypothetical protein
MVKFNINLSNKTFYLLIAILAVLVVSGVAFAYGTNNPAVMGHTPGELDASQCANGQVLKKISGVWACGDVSSGGGASLTFDVSNSDLSTWTCVDQNLKDLCGDDDGCDIRLNLQHEADSGSGNYDEVKTAVAHIYMEGSMSNNLHLGKYGSTSWGGGSVVNWITNATTSYTIFDAYGGWLYMLNYKHSYCGGNSIAYTDPYKFTFMSHYNVKAKVFIYD